MTEVQLTPIGKLFFGNLMAWIANDTPLNFKLKGEPDKMQAILDVVVASKRYQEELHKPGATIEEIMKKANEKNNAANKFSELTGYKWPL